MAGSFLDTFDKKQRQKIEKVGRRVSLPEGWSPISESTSADKLYIILSGEVSVRKHGEEIGRMGAGEVMGERAILGHSLRTASLVALTKLELIHLSDTDVATLCKEMPEFQKALEDNAAAHQA